MPDLEPAGETTKFLPKKNPRRPSKKFRKFWNSENFRNFFEGLRGIFFLEGIF